LEDVANFIRQRIKGTLGKLGGSQGGGYNRLTEDAKQGIKKALLDRENAIKLGQTPEQISSISKRFNCSDVTVNKYKAELGLTKKRDGSAAAPAAAAS
jgi:hypothetical protein